MPYDAPRDDPDAPYRGGVPLSPIRAAALRKRSSRNRQQAAPCPPVVPPKPIWASRTLWLNVIGLLLLVAASPEIVEIIPVESRPFIAAGVAFLNILNRMLSPISPLTIRPKAAEGEAAPEGREEVDDRTA